MLKESPLPTSSTNPPAFLSAYLPPAAALIFPPFQMLMALDRAGVLRPTLLFSSALTHSYSFWLNPSALLAAWAFRRLGGEKPVSGSAPPSRCGLAQSKPTPSKTGRLSEGGSWNDAPRHTTTVRVITDSCGGQRNGCF